MINIYIYIDICRRINHNNFNNWCFGKYPTLVSLVSNLNYTRMNWSGLWCEYLVIIIILQIGSVDVTLTHICAHKCDVSSCMEKPTMACEHYSTAKQERKVNSSYNRYDLLFYLLGGCSNRNGKILPPSDTSPILQPFTRCFNPLLFSLRSWPDRKQWSRCKGIYPQHTAQHMVCLF